MCSIIAVTGSNVQFSVQLTVQCQIIYRTGTVAHCRLAAEPMCTICKKICNKYDLKTICTIYEKKYAKNMQNMHYRAKRISQ